MDPGASGLDAGVRAPPPGVVTAPVPASDGPIVTSSFGRLGTAEFY
jgi:hypothetical protein